MSKKAKPTMAVKKKRMTRQRAEALRPMSPNQSSSDENNQSVCSRVRRIKQEDIEGVHAGIKMEPAEVTDSDLDDVKLEPQEVKEEEQQISSSIPTVQAFSRGRVAKRKSYSCPKCAETCSQRLALQKHYYKVHRFPVPCPKCKARFKEQSGLVQHLKKKHQVQLPNPHQCPKCPKSFLYLNRLQRHMTSHTGLRKFVCEICRKGTTSRDLLTNHMKRVHSSIEDRVIPCLKCDKRFATQTLLTQHLNNSHKKQEKKKSLDCIFCGKKFREKQNQHDHIRSHIQEMPHFCKVCSKAFPSLKGIFKHRWIHLDKTIECELCCFKCKTKKELERHVERAHMSMEGRICVFCGMEMINQKTLRKHIYGHIRENQHSCTTCGKCLLTSRDLKRHRRKCVYGH